MTTASRPTAAPARPQSTRNTREPWQDGACGTSEAFHRPAGEPRAAAERRIRAAKAVCTACPVRVECRRHALATREPFGVRGGLSAEERRALFTGSEQLQGPLAA
ncbi:WhiB family transcriptional regulator [Kitasatospora sp. NPDC096147]|uniref:WhiB family transcriptional regulator n=1 Tax=Kitasatospora sp. NPDC096147 TaxID=3364093 RepID=UPI0037F36B30